ncbi:MAG: helix-turn-helix transcriptional regulator [Caldisphaera sp.]|jgi:DNA-binding Lrp family transcriptional regulator|nr:MAG: MarR family transcriptional regulator [Caldisphaera sp.]
MPRNSDENEKAALDLIKGYKEGVLQSELWKMMGLDSREGSRLVLRLSKKGLIKREQVTVNGRRTYRLFVAEKPIESKILNISLSSILDIPCTTCPHIDECGLGGYYEPSTCPLMELWLKKEVKLSSIRQKQLMQKAS